jgi:hypothetical protein
MATHDLDLADGLVTRVALVRGGRLIADEPAGSGLRARYRALSTMPTMSAIPAPSKTSGPSGTSGTSGASTASGTPGMPLTPEHP